MINLDDLQVKFKFTEQSGEILAILTIEDDTISLRGFLIMKSKFLNRRGEYLRLVPPTFGAKHHFAVYFKDKEFWYKVEDKIWDKFEVETFDNIANEMEVVKT